MKVASLFSGGKDSVYATYLSLKEGFEVTNLVSMISENKDSWMFHSVNIHLTDLQAEAMNIPIVKVNTKGEKEKELVDLEERLATLDIDGVVSGAIASSYQKDRIDKICERLGLKSFTPLWNKNQESLLQELVEEGFKVLIVGVFAEGFNASWLGRKIDKKTIEDLKKIKDKYLINIAGEGGEFETLVVDGPCFSKKLALDETENIWRRDSGRLIVKKAHLTKK